MSEEEKKAIEYLENRLDILHNNTQWATEENIKIVLNLIEKQQKEIEELKKYDYRNIKISEDNKLSSIHFTKEQLDLMNLGIALYINIFKESEDEIKELTEKNASLQKEIKLMKSININDNFISKDKIKKKIKELKNIIEFEKPIYEDSLEDTIDILEKLLEE